MQPLLDHKERTDTQLIIEKHRFRLCSTSTDAAKLKEKTQLSVAPIHTSNGLRKKSSVHTKIIVSSLNVQSKGKRIKRSTWAKFLALLAFSQCLN